MLLGQQGFVSCQATTTLFGICENRNLDDFFVKGIVEM